jgi:hypothetical protein
MHRMHRSRGFSLLSAASPTNSVCLPRLASGARHIPLESSDLLSAAPSFNWDSADYRCCRARDLRFFWPHPALARMRPFNDNGDIT